MIMHDISTRTALVHTCGHKAHLIEARGRMHTDPRLFGKPARQFHVECTHCAVGTAPVYSPRVAEKLWSFGDSVLVPLADMPALRIAAERSLLAA